MLTAVKVKYHWTIKGHTIKISGAHKTFKRYREARAAFAPFFYEKLIHFLAIHRKKFSEENNDNWRRMHVFCTADGRRLNTISSIVKARTIELCGGSGYTNNDFRRSIETEARQRQLNTKSIARCLLHDEKTADEHYVVTSFESLLGVYDNYGYLINYYH